MDVQEYNCGLRPTVVSPGSGQIIKSISRSPGMAFLSVRGGGPQRPLLNQTADIQRQAKKARAHICRADRMPIWNEREGMAKGYPLLCLDDNAALHDLAYRMSRPMANNPNEEDQIEHRNWKCPKCKNKEFEADQFAATGGGLTKFFNIQSKKYTTVTCTSCRYTEMYKTNTSTLGNVLDFFGN